MAVPLVATGWRRGDEPNSSLRIGTVGAMLPSARSAGFSLVGGYGQAGVPRAGQSGLRQNSTSVSGSGKRPHPANRRPGRIGGGSPMRHHLQSCRYWQTSEAVRLAHSLLGPDANPPYRGPALWRQRRPQRAHPHWQGLDPLPRAGKLSPIVFGDRESQTCLEFVGQGRYIMWECKAHRRGVGRVEEGREE